MTTIWGRTQHQHKLAEGVYEVDTARHGGIIVRWDVAEKRISDKVHEIVKPDFAYGYYHFEEDCDWAAFAYENQELFNEKMRSYIVPTLERWHPKLLK